MILTTDKKKAAEKELLSKIYRETPSQLPFNCTVISYMRMIHHCSTVGDGHQEIWCCRKTGAKVNMTVNYRTIYKQSTGELQATKIPVGILWCSACDTKPQVVPDSSLWDTEIRTLCM